MDKIILIGGAPTAGKSYTARKLAEELKLPWISTDMIREVMRQLVRKEDYPKLFQHAEATSDLALEFLTHNTPEQIIQHQNDESTDVWRGVMAFMDTDYVWGSFIIEGVAILPHLVDQVMLKDKEVKSLFLVDEDEERVRKVIFTRGLWDDAGKYPDSVKEKEVRWVLAFNKWLMSEAEKFSLPVVKIGGRDSYIEEVRSLI